jgi:MFS family permease
MPIITSYRFTMTDAFAQPISDSQREQVYRRNFGLFLTDGILFTVAMSLIGSTTTIPDFIRHLTKSEILIGLSSSLFDVGWTLPQLFIARYIVRYARKKWWFAGPNIPVRFVMVIFAVVTVILGKDRPEAILAAFLICYGIAAVGDGIAGRTRAGFSEQLRARFWCGRLIVRHLDHPYLAHPRTAGRQSSGENSRAQ